MLIEMVSRELLPYPNPMYRPPPKAVEIPLQETPRKLTDLDIDINTNFEENSPHQEGKISETYQRPDKSCFQEPLDVESSIDTGSLVQMFLPKQAEIDKI